MVRLPSRSLWNVESLFSILTSKSTDTWNISTYLGPMYGSNTTVQSFIIIIIIIINDNDLKSYSRSNKEYLINRITNVR